MIHVDTKRLARFERVGHRITGDRRQGCSRGVGHEKVHVAIDDATRLPYEEVLPDEQKATTVGFLARAVGWFSAPATVSSPLTACALPLWRMACSALDLKAIPARPHTPGTNGKTERFIKTLLADDQDSRQRGAR